MGIYLRHGEVQRAENVLLDMMRHGVEPWVMNFTVLLGLLGTHMKDKEDVCRLVRQLDKAG